MTVKVSDAQRQARLMERHRLAAADPTVTEATRSMLVLHATDPVTVYLSAWARTGCTAGEVDAALYTERSLVRMLGMRRTVFIVPAEQASLVQAAATDDVARRLRRQLEKDLAGGGVGDGDAGGWLRSVEAGVLEALAARGGGAAGAELSEAEPRLRTQLVYSPDKSYGGAAYITSRALVLMAAEGRIIRGRRRGGWSSGQFEWNLPQAWLHPDEPGPAADDAEGLLADRLGTGLDAAAARAELARRWLSVFGPAPAADLQWWAGWTGGQTKAALAELPVADVDLEGQPGVALDGDLDFPSAPEPAAALLPALDPTPMGWQSRDWYLGPHAPRLFDRTGNIGPTVWWAGRVVGGWAQRASGEVVWRPLEDIGTDASTAVDEQARRLEAWLGADRVTPRFRTPLERELLTYPGA
jgi:Winged helix DNA-binding domain